MIEGRLRRLEDRLSKAIAAINEISDADTPQRARETEPEVAPSPPPSRGGQPPTTGTSDGRSNADVPATEPGTNPRQHSSVDTDAERNGDVEDGQPSDRATLTRRPYLKLLGVAAAPAFAQSVGATTETGYGTGGYGADGYGGSTSGDDEDSVPSVVTRDATSVTEVSATLTGELETVDGADSVHCSFEWRKAGESDWNTTAGQTRTTAGSFSETVDGLESGVDYEFRAIAETSTGDATGETSAFVTASDDSSAVPPTIDTYDVREDSPPNPHAEIHVDWAVSDADGDLDTVLVEVYADGETSPLESATTPVDGAEASGSDSFTIKKGAGDAYRIELLASDSAGAVASDERELRAGEG